jgi:hypothetical protein
MSSSLVTGSCGAPCGCVTLVWCRVHSRSAAAMTYPMIICAPIGVVGRSGPPVHADGVADNEPHFTTPPSRVAGEYSAARVGARSAAPMLTSHETGNLQLAGTRDSSWREGLIGVSGGDMGSWERNRCDCNVAPP